MIFFSFYTQKSVIGLADTDTLIIGYRPIWPIRLLSADTDTDIGPFTNVVASIVRFLWHQRLEAWNVFHYLGIFFTKID